MSALVASSVVALQQAERLTGLPRSDATTTVAMVVLIVCAAMAVLVAAISATMAWYRKHSHRDAQYHRHSWV